MSNNIMNQPLSMSQLIRHAGTAIALAPLLPVIILMWTCYLLSDDETANAECLRSPNSPQHLKTPATALSV